MWGQVLHIDKKPKSLLSYSYHENLPPPIQAVDLSLSSAVQTAIYKSANKKK